MEEAMADLLSIVTQRNQTKSKASQGQLIGTTKPSH